MPTATMETSDDVGSSTAELSSPALLKTITGTDESASNFDDPPVASTSAQNGHSEEPMDVLEVSSTNGDVQASTSTAIFSVPPPNYFAPAAAVVNHAYAGFGTPAQEPKPFIGPKLPDDYKEQKKKQLAQQPPRVPSPVSTEAREKLLQLHNLKQFTKKPAKLSGIGQLLSSLRKRNGDVSPERADANEDGKIGSFWMPNSSSASTTDQEIQVLTGAFFWIV